MDTLVLSILVENNAGVLNRVAGLFSRRAFNIDSLSVGETQDPRISRITVVCHGDAPSLVQIQKQVAKLEEVISLQALPRKDSVLRELVLIKVEADRSNRNDIVEIANLFRAKVVDVSPDSLVIEATGNTQKINSLLVMLDGFNVVETARTGLSGMLRGL